MMNSEIQIIRLLDILNKTPYESKEKEEILRNEVSMFLFGKKHSFLKESSNSEDSLAVMIEKLHTEQFLKTQSMITEGELPTVFYKHVVVKNKNGEEEVMRVPKTKEELEKENEESLLRQFEDILQLNRRQLIKKEKIVFNPATYGMCMATLTTMMELWKKDSKKYIPFYRMMKDYIELVHFNTLMSEEYQDLNMNIRR